MNDIEASEIYLYDYLINKTERYLNLLQKKYKLEKDLGIFIVDEEIKVDQTHIPITLVIRFYRNWVQILVPLLPLDCITEEKKVTFYELLLSLNNEFADTEFELDKNLGLIMISNEMHIDGYVYDVFEEEYNAILVVIQELVRKARNILPNIAEVLDKGIQRWLKKYTEPFKQLKEGPFEAFT